MSDESDKKPKMANVTFRGKRGQFKSWPVPLSLIGYYGGEDAGWLHRDAFSSTFGEPLNRSFSSSIDFPSYDAADSKFLVTSEENSLESRVSEDLAPREEGLRDYSPITDGTDRLITDEDVGSLLRGLDDELNRRGAEEPLTVSLNDSRQSASENPVESNEEDSFVPITMEEVRAGIPAAIAAYNLAHSRRPFADRAEEVLKKTFDFTKRAAVGTYNVSKRTALGVYNVSSRGINFARAHPRLSIAAGVGAGLVSVLPISLVASDMKGREVYQGVVEGRAVTYREGAGLGWLWGLIGNERNVMKVRDGVTNYTFTDSKGEKPLDWRSDLTGPLPAAHLEKAVVIRPSLSEVFYRDSPRTNMQRELGPEFFQKADVAYTTILEGIRYQRQRALGREIRESINSLEKVTGEVKDTCSLYD